MDLLAKIKNKQALVGIIGLGYVGLPLVLRFCQVGFRVMGFDTDDRKVEALNRGESYIKHIPSARLAEMLKSGNGQQFEAISDMARLGEPDVLIICVPTPLTPKREPDLRFITSTTRQIAISLRAGQLVSLESTTYPGTTAELVLPLLSDGLQVGRDFYLVFSPEREDPGNAQFEVRTIPKVVGGITPACLEHGVALYQHLPGGSYRDGTYGMTMDPTGLIVVTGRTESFDFPMTAGAPPSSTTARRAPLTMSLMS